MKILLIKPGIGNVIKKYNLDDGRMEPLSLGVIASLTPPAHEVSLVDDRLEEINYEEKADLVAITVDTYTAKKAYDISNQFKRIGVPVVLGGIHVTLLPSEAKQHADSIVIGDAETVWKKLLMDLQTGELKKVYIGDFKIPQNGCLPNRSLFIGKGYLPVSIIQFTRGCPYSCSFCSTAGYFNHTHIFRDHESVVEEIREVTDRDAHISIDALGSVNTCSNSILCLRKGGRHVQVGLMVGEDYLPRLPMDQVIAKELQIYGSHGMQANKYGSMFDMISSGKLNPGLLIGKTIRLEEAPKELEQMDHFDALGITVIDKF